MDDNLIKPISPSPTGVKHTSKKKHTRKERHRRNKDNKDDKSSDSSSSQGKVIDDYA